MLCLFYMDTWLLMECLGNLSLWIGENPFHSYLLNPAQPFNYQTHYQDYGFQYPLYLQRGHEKDKYKEKTPAMRMRMRHLVENRMQTDTLCTQDIVEGGYTFEFLNLIATPIDFCLIFFFR